MADWAKMMAVYFALEVLFGPESVSQSYGITYFLIAKNMYIHPYIKNWEISTN